MADKEQEQEETRWIDAQIRWDDVVVVRSGVVEREKSVDVDDDAAAAAVLDIFADPHPQETFIFAEQPPAPTAGRRCRSDNNDKDNNNNNNTIINVRLDGYKADSDAVWQSTGLTLWSASLALSRYLLLQYNNDDEEGSVVRPGLTILELGAGLGLCGIVAHQLQEAALSSSSSRRKEQDQDDHDNHVDDVDAAADDIEEEEEKPTTNHNTSSSSFVYLTDGDTDALIQLRHNVEHNRRSDRMACHQLLWGTAPAVSFAQKHGCQKMDVILASDIVYVSSIVPPLFETISVLLKKEPAAIFILAFDSRRDVPVTIDYVLQEAEQVGLTYEKTSNDLYLFRWSELSLLSSSSSGVVP